VAGKNAIYFLAVGALSAFVLFPGKKKGKARCVKIRSRDDYRLYLGSTRSVKFPAAIVYHPDNVTAEKAAVFCGLTHEHGWTVMIVKASDYNQWSGENIEPGVVIMTSSKQGAFKKWAELAG